MKYRVFTETWVVARNILDYLLWHRALVNFIDRDKTLNHKSYDASVLYLNNGSEFVIAPPNNCLDLGNHYDEYAEYDSNNNCPLEVLFFVIDDICKEIRNGNYTATSSQTH